MDAACIHDVTTELSVDLHPSKLRDVLGSVHEQLGSLLLRYREDLRGVVLAYRDVSILNKTAVVHGFFPYFHIDVKAKLQVLKLLPEQKLVGTVNKVGHDYLGLLIMGAFNAAITKKDMKGHFKHDKQGGYWVHCADASHILQVGSQVLFKVNRIEHQDSHFIVMGGLQEAGLGNVDLCCAAEQQQGRAAAVTLATGSAAASNALAGLLSKVGTGQAAGVAADAERGSRKKDKKRKRSSEGPAVAEEPVAGPGREQGAGKKEKKRRKGGGGLNGDAKGDAHRRNDPGESGAKRGRTMEQDTGGQETNGAAKEVMESPNGVAMETTEVNESEGCGNGKRPKDKKSKEEKAQRNQKKEKKAKVKKDKNRKEES